MALAHAILVCLADRPLTGYDLAKEFDSTVAFFWRADHPQIYRELSSLRAKGLVIGERVQQTGRPNKIVYSLTEEGRRTLRTWSATPSPSLPVKDDFLLKFHALDHMDVAAIRREIAERLAQHEKTRELYGGMQRIKQARMGAGDTNALGRYLSILIGVRYEDAWISWCRDALAALDGIPRDGSEIATDR